MALRVVAIWAFLAPLLNVVSAQGNGTNGGRITPVGKVIELLDVLDKKLEEDGVADGDSYNQFMDWYRNESATVRRIIEETRETISTLTTNIDDQKAFQDSQRLRLDQTAGEVASAEADLSKATKRREKEHATFEDAEATLVEAVDSLERSLVVLGKQAPAAASFVDVSSVAQRLKSMLLQSEDIKLSSAQRETLDAFVHQASKAERAQRRKADEAEASKTLMPDFLQVKSSSLRGQAEQPYGEYQTQTSGVTSTLQSVLDQSSQELDDTRQAEVDAKSNYTALATSLNQEIENKKTTMSQIKTQIAQSEESTSQMQAQLAAAQNLLKVTEESQAEMQAQYVRKSDAYKERVAKRSDEVMAVQEAHFILTSEVASNAFRPDNSSLAAPSLLQVAKSSGGVRGMGLLKAASSSGVALLAVKMETHRLKRRADPFAKAKQLIRDLVEKLQKEHAAEAEKKEWCDREMADSLASQKSKNMTLVKLNDRIGVMDAEIEQLEADIATVQQDLSEMQANIQVAASAREAEKNRNANAILHYKDAIELLNMAISVLRKYYNSDAANQESGYNSQKSRGTGVISILEIALADYNDLTKEVSEYEAQSDKEFTELSHEADIKTAVFQKDLEYKDRAKVKLEGDKMRASTEVNTVGQELAAVEQYLDQLHKDCTRKVETYEERKAKRNEEIENLQSALETLQQNQ